MQVLPWGSTGPLSVRTESIQSFAQTLTLTGQQFLLTINCKGWLIKQLNESKKQSIGAGSGLGHDEVVKGE